MSMGDEKGKKMRALEEDEGLTHVCWGPAGVCFHSAASPDELPDVIFWGGLLALQRSLRQCSH